MHNKILYVNGTDITHFDDLVDDASLPFGGAKYTWRYAEALAAFHNANKEVRRVVGHSLGAAVAKQFARDYDLAYELYATPAFFPKKDKHSHRQWFDPISLFDRGASQQAPLSWNPHSYAEARGVYG